MSSANWIATLVLGSLPLSVLAEPLAVYTSTSGQVTALHNSFAEFGLGMQPGMPITVDFDGEYNTSFATVESGTFTTRPDAFFSAFGVTIGGTRLDFGPPPAYDPLLLNQIQLQNNVPGAVGNLVDVFELSARAHTQYANVTYTMTAHLEFAPGTFSDLDAWSILAVEDAQLLGGTIALQRFNGSNDGAYTNGSLTADVRGFDVHFDGPGAEVPPVPEPGQYAMLLAGLAGAAVWRRRPGCKPGPRF